MMKDPSKKTKETKSIPIVYPEYSKRELDDFRDFLNGFLEEKQVKSYKMKEIEVEVIDSSREGVVISHKEKQLVRDDELKTVHIVNLDEAMVAFGAMVKKVSNGQTYYAVLMPRKQIRVDFEMNDVLDPSKYELFQHKYAALKDRDYKREYAEKKQTEEYANIIETSEVGHDFPE